MKKNRSGFTPLLFLILLMIIFIGWHSFAYETAENEYTVIKQFGEIKKINSEPGLRFKAPFIQNVSSIPKCKQFYDLQKSDVITADKKTMLVDAFITWKVTDPKVFTTSLNANIETAKGRLDVIVYNAIKTTSSNMTQEELILSRDDDLETANNDTELDDVEINDISAEEIAEDDGNTQNTEDSAATEEPEIIAISQKLKDCIGNQCEPYGIAIETIEVKVLDLPDENKAAVYNRMVTERNNIAAAYTAQGAAEAQKIKNMTDKEVSVMVSNAKAEAEKIVAEGEAEYMRTMSEAYADEAKADYYAFVRSLDAAKASLSNTENTLFLNADSPIAQVFQGIH